MPVMESLKRYYTEQPASEQWTLTGPEYHHLADVMRARVGETVLLCNGDGMDYRCEVLSLANRTATLRTISAARNEQEPEADVTAFLGLLKGDHTELEIQKLSELGVRRIVPFGSENTVAKADERKIERFRRIAAESAKQCGRASVLQVENAVPFRAAIGRAGAFDRALFCDECAEGKSLAKALGSGSGNRVALMIGSEGGFTAAEAEQAVAAGWTAVTLGRRILRAETAAIASAAVVMNALGELGDLR